MSQIVELHREPLQLTSTLKRTKLNEKLRLHDIQFSK